MTAVFAATLLLCRFAAPLLRCGPPVAGIRHLSKEEVPVSAKSSIQPSRGNYVRDAKTGMVGIVMDFSLGQYWLRPVGGGREWVARPSDLREITQAELLSERVAAANRQQQACGRA
ncbi:hypothetical protein EYS09_24565 [Streptomyces kasugaensis]|uniref:Uncharacterized protein n=1 Tax=Streptomyces kasugaensis TaxID=1946 RepID=A0A4Q9HSD5_STRKA|nr:hypothetical protein [Streptomyces kasugaensis]TBO57080.1 hypothetical protein EYS09_24565 [Streptomyces kasugaensis]